MNDALLKYAIDNGMIDLSYVQEQIEMKKREELLQKHPYKIWTDINDYWYTYLPKGNGQRKLIKRKKKEDLINIVISFWEAKNNNSFMERYDIWIDRQKKCNSSAFRLN